MLAPGPESKIKKLIADVLDAIVKEGFQIVGLGGASAWGPTNTIPRGVVPRQDVKVEPGSFFCPGCGTHNPPYGFTGSHATIAGFGEITYMTIFCGVESCRRIHNVLILGMTPGSKMGHT